MMYSHSRHFRLLLVIACLVLLSVGQVYAKTRLQTITFIPTLTEALTLPEALGAANPLFYEVAAVTNFSVYRSNNDPSYDPEKGYVPISFPTGAGIVYNSYSIKDNTSVSANSFLSGYLSTSNAVNGNTVRFENLQSNTGYTMFVYSQSAISGDAVSLKVNGEGIGTLTTTGTGTSSFTEGVNYIQVDVTTDVYGMITLNYSNASGRGVINAVQLSEAHVNPAAVPEPGTVTFVFLGVAAVHLVRRLNNRMNMVL